MIEVLLVDDSSVIRAYLQKIIDAQDGVRVCASAENGEQAMQIYRDMRPDIVIMDVEMPGLDGIEALRQILAFDARARVIMCSAFTQAGGNVTMKALEIGAVDYILKPTTGSEESSADLFSQSLIRKIRSSVRKPPAQDIPYATSSPTVHAVQGPITLRPSPAGFSKADIIAIGSSTGGVQALFACLEGLGTKHPGIPIVITQHMPATFTKILAAHIEQKTGLSSVEAEEHMAVENNRVYIAPGGRHMEIARKNGTLRIHLSDEPPENFCRPSVDPMVRSLLSADIPHILTVILTGMGSDGFASAKTAVEQGHMLIAQDEATSIVWGMPGAVAMAGLCHAVLPLDRIGPYIKRYL